MSRAVRCALSILLVAGLLAGCAGAVRDESLRVRLYNYSAAIRWNDIPTAIGYLDPIVLAEKPPSAATLERWAQVQVTRYFEGPQSTDAQGNFRQSVQVEIVDSATQSVRTIIDRQVWRYDEQAQTWWLTSGLPDLDAAQ